jgi:3-dehydroquinate dehydratase
VVPPIADLFTHPHSLPRDFLVCNHTQIPDRVLNQNRPSVLQVDDHNGLSASPRIIQTQRRLSKIKKIILIQGANLTYLGKREPEIYGRITPDELSETLLDYAKRRGFELEILYTNLEGEAINRIYQCADQGFDGVVMNPAGFSYAGYGLKDCIKGAGLPYVEIHISNAGNPKPKCAGRSQHDRSAASSERNPAPAYCEYLGPAYPPRAVLEHYRENRQ